MSYPVYGQYQSPEPLSNLDHLHLVAPGTTTLTTSDHESPLAILDQSDLLAQGIHCSRFIPGCKVDPDALGSCTAEATTADAAKKHTPEDFVLYAKHLIQSSYANGPTGYTDAIGAQRAAIAFYYRCTHQTGNSGEEWPPTDCGSSGPYIATEAIKLGIASGQLIGHGAESILSLLQKEGVLMGSPWFYKWEEPDNDGFVDGDGSIQAIQECIQSGVAGGHETRLAAIEKIAFLPNGHVDAYNTIVRDRNSWSKSWGDNGCCRFHLSTLVALGGQCDFRQLTV